MKGGLIIFLNLTIQILCTKYILKLCSWMHLSQKNVHTLAKNKIQKIAKAKFKWKKLSKKYSQKTSDCR